MTWEFDRCFEIWSFRHDHKGNKGEAAAYIQESDGLSKQPQFMARFHFTEFIVAFRT